MLKIVHLPRGRWRFETSDGRHQSETYAYESYGFWMYGPYLFVGQTEYYGEEKVWFALDPKVQPHESVDRTMP